MKNARPTTLILFFIIFMGVHTLYCSELSQDLDVKIYTSPFELNGPHDRYDLTGENDLSLIYYVECRNIGAHPAENCTLNILLPQSYLMSSNLLGLSNSNFELLDQTTREYSFASEDFERGSMTRFWIQANIDVAAIPDPDTTIRPPATSSCVTVQADAFLYNAIEYESYTDNTTICKTVPDDSFFVDLEVTKEAAVRCDENVIEYIITVTNLGDRIVENVTVMDLLPANTDTTSAGDPPAAYIPPMNAAYWEIDQILPGLSEQIRLMVEITSDERPMDFWNTVIVQSDSIESYYSNNTFVLFSTCREDSCFDLQVNGAISDISGNGTAEPTESLFIEIKCSNIGNMPVDSTEIALRFDNLMPITGDHVFHWSFNNMYPGDNVTVYLWVQLEDACNPSVEYIQGEVTALGYDPIWDECDISDNDVNLSITYDCLVECPPLDAIPRIITPNADGYNDELIFSAGFDAITRVFDRRGVLVRSLEDGEAWDGTDDAGEFLQPGLYVWQMFCPASKTDKPYYTGTVAIKR